MPLSIMKFNQAGGRFVQVTDGFCKHGVLEVEARDEGHRGAFLQAVAIGFTGSLLRY